jgi:hypothetical protein
MSHKRKRPIWREFPAALTRTYIFFVLSVRGRSIVRHCAFKDRTTVAVDFKLISINVVSRKFTQLKSMLLERKPTLYFIQNYLLPSQKSKKRLIGIKFPYLLVYINGIGPSTNLSNVEKCGIRTLLLNIKPIHCCKRRLDSRLPPSVFRGFCSHSKCQEAHWPWSTNTMRRNPNLATFTSHAYDLTLAVSSGKSTSLPEGGEHHMEYWLHSNMQYIFVQKKMKTRPLKIHEEVCACVQIGLVCNRCADKKWMNR